MNFFNFCAVIVFCFTSNQLVEGQELKKDNKIARTLRGNENDNAKKLEENSPDREDIKAYYSSNIIPTPKPTPKPTSIPYSPTEVPSLRPSIDETIITPYEVEVNPIRGGCSDCLVSEVTMTESFILEFDIMPLATITWWGSIIQIGDSWGQRNPAVWFAPGSFNLQIRVATDKLWNVNANPSTPLTINEWSRVKIEVTGSISVYVNDVLSAQVKTISTRRNYEGDYPIYVSNPWFNPANCNLKNIVLITFSKNN